MKNVTRINKPKKNSDVGEKIKYVRTKILMSQDVLADKIGRKRPELTMYETGKRTPDIYTLRDIAVTLGVSTDYLLGISDVETNDIDSIAINKITGLSEGAIKNLVYLNKYHHGHLLSTINYLLEQEQLLPEEYYSSQSKGNKSITNEELAQAFDEWKNNDYKRIISNIDSYFNVQIENEEEFYITTPSIQKQKEITDMYDYVATKAIVPSKELADTVLLKQIEKLLENAKEDYLRDNIRNEED